MPNLRRSPASPFPPRGEQRGLPFIILAGASAVTVMLLFGGASQEVRPERDGFVTVPPATAWEKVQAAVGLGEPAPEPSADTPGRRLAEGLRLRPMHTQGRIGGYVIGGDSNADVLALTRLRRGDVLVAVDDGSLDADRIANLGDELSLLDAVEVTFIRAGATRKRTIDLRS